MKWKNSAKAQTISIFKPKVKSATLALFKKPEDTAECIAKENGIGRRTVYRAVSFAKAVDAQTKGCDE